jgi:hypothetical protein
MTVFVDRAAKAGVNPRDLHDFVTLDDINDEATKERLIAIRQTGDLALYATELGLARIRQAESKAQQ